MSARVEEIRYTRYSGERRGRAAAIWSLARWSALTALGARRGWRAKLIPIFLIGVACIPALMVLGVRALAPARVGDEVADFFTYPVYYFEIGLTVALFAGVIGPELLCPDRRDRVLSLYFSTAVSRLEYVAGKVLGMMLPLALVTVLPVTALFVGNAIFAEDSLPYLRDHWGDIPRIFAAGAIISLYFGLLVLAVSSLTSRRAFAIGGYLALVILSQLTAGFLLFGAEVTRYASLIALGRVPIVAARGVFSREDAFPNGVPIGWYYVVTFGVMAVSLAVLALRYRRGDGT